MSEVNYKSDIVEVIVKADIVELNITNSVLGGIGGGGGGANALNDLTDVTITAAASGDYLRYNGTAWVDGSIQAADLPSSIDASKIADGSISNTEFQYLNNVSSNIQTQLDGKAATSHTHAISDVTSLQTTLDGKAASSHTHIIGDVTGLQTALDGKAATSHTHSISQVTGLQTALDGKAATSHTHAISDVTNLQTTLDGKASTSHTHTLDDLSDVTITTPSNNQVLKYNGTAWVNSSDSTGITSLNGLSGSSQTFATTLNSGSTFTFTSSGTSHSLNIPYADTGVAGIISASSQSIPGPKTFLNELNNTAISIGGGNLWYSQSQSWLGNTVSGLHTVRFKTTSSVAATANTVVAHLVVDPANITESASAGTHPLMTAVAIKPLNITDSANASTTNGATLYVEGPATGTATVTNNYSVWVDSGVTRLDGDVELHGIASGTTSNVVYYDTTTKKITYGAVTGGGGATNLDGLTDVTITSAATGEYIRYNGTQWVDATIQAGDLPSAIDAAKIANGNVSNTEFQYLDGVTSAIQTQIDGKASTSHTHTINDLSDVTITAAASGEFIRYSGTEWVDSSIQAADLPTGIDAAKIATGTVSNTEFGYLDGVTSAIQTQIDGKAATSHTHTISDVTNLQTSLDAKVTGNAAITGATKTKVTYDAKGLVTAGADANLDDLGDVVITTPSTNQVLSYNGTNWVNAAATGGVTDGDKGDITVSNGGTTWTIDAGAVTYADIQNVAANSFLANVTGSAATVQAVATTRIPLFASAITGTPSASTYLRGDGSWATPAGSGTVTSVAMTVPTGLTVTGSPITTTGTLAITLTAGYDFLNNTTQTIAGAKTFSSAPTFSTMTAGSILFAGTSGVVSQTNAQLFWDNTNNRLGVGTSSPANKLDVIRGTAGAMGRGTYESASFSFDGDMKFGLYTAAAAGSGGASLMFGATGFTVSSYYPGFELQYSPSATLASNYMQFNYVNRTSNGTVFSATTNILVVHQGGVVTIGTTTNSGFKLDVNGTTRVQGQLTVSTGGAAITGNSTITGTLNVTSTFTLSDAQNFVVGSTTGTKIGTATSQKIGFWNAAPIVQPTTSVAAAAFVANTGTAVNDASTFGGYTIRQVVQALQNLGLLA